MVKALDLSSNGRMSAWVRTPLLVNVLSRRQSKTSVLTSITSTDTDVDIIHGLIVLAQ